MPRRNSNKELTQKLEHLETELKGSRQIEKIIWETQDQLYMVLDSLDAIVYVSDFETYNILFVNTYTEKRFGNIVGKLCWKSLQAGQEGPCPFCTNDKLLNANGEPAEPIEYECQNTADERWYYIRDKAIKWLDGRLVRLEIAVDITERHNYQQAIEKSEEKFRTIADYTYDWEYWLSPDNEFVYVSPSCEAINGYTAMEFINDPSLMLSITHPEDREMLKKHLDEELALQDAKHLNYRIVTKHGLLRWIGHICQPVYDSQGNFLGRRASNRNITYQKQIEEKLRESENRLRLALDAGSDGVWDRNIVTNETYYGENWYRTLGYDESDNQDKHLSWDKLLHPGDKEKALFAVQDYIEGRNDRYEIEFRMRNKKGRWQWFLSRGKIVEWDATGRPLRIIGTHTDITRLKKYEIELKNAQLKLEKKIKLRTSELEEMNVALKILLKKQQEERKKHENEISANINTIIIPYIEQLNNSKLTEQQKSIVHILKSNLDEICFPFVHSFSVKYATLTPTEIKIANLIRLVKRTKEIAELMSLSPGTIHIHRKNIRKKLSITNKRVNLQSILSSHHSS